MGISVDGAIDGLKLSTVGCSVGGTTPCTVLSREFIGTVMGILISLVLCYHYSSMDRSVYHYP